MVTLETFHEMHLLSSLPETASTLSLVTCAMTPWVHLFPTSHHHFLYARLRHQLQWETVMHFPMRSYKIFQRRCKQSFSNGGRVFCDPAELLS